MKKKYLLGLFFIFIFLFAGCKQQAKNIDELGVAREFGKRSVEIGETTSVKLRINLNEGQTFYLIDDEVPFEFEVIGEKDTNNHVKVAVIQDAKSTVYEYAIKATKKGEYFFDGEYFFEGMDSPLKIAGENKITVKWVTLV